MIAGRCSHCRETGVVFRVRMAEVGLRWLDADCQTRLVNLGMHIVPVTDADPRVEDLGPARRLNPPPVGARVALRESLRMLRWMAPA